MRMNGWMWIDDSPSTNSVLVRPEQISIRQTERQLQSILLLLLVLLSCYCWFNPGAVFTCDPPAISVCPFHRRRFPYATRGWDGCLNTSSFIHSRMTDERIVLHSGLGGGNAPMINSNTKPPVICSIHPFRSCGSATPSPFSPRIDTWWRPAMVGTCCILKICKRRTLVITGTY